MRPGEGETIITLDRPKETKAFRLGCDLLQFACIDGKGNFEDHFCDQLDEFRANHHFAYPDRFNDFIPIELKQYETSVLALQSITALRHHYVSRVLLERFRYRPLANRILDQLVKEKGSYSLRHSE